MRICAGNAKGADAGNGRPAVRGPGRLPPLHQHRNAFPGDSRVGRLKVQAGRQHRVLQRQRHLDQPSNARSPFRVAQVRLDRTDATEVSFSAALRQHIAQCLELDRITCARASPMRLNILHMSRNHRGIGIGLAQQVLLACGPRRGQEAAAAPVIVDRAAADHGIDRVAGGHGISQAFEYDQPSAFAAHIAVPASIAELAAAIGGHHLGLRIGNRDLRLQDDVDPTSQGHGALAIAQAAARQVHRHQRRRAGCVHRKAGALESKQVRKPAGGAIAPTAGGHVEVSLGRIVEEPCLVIAQPDAGKHTCFAQARRLRNLTGIFQRFPGNFQQQPLLRVQAVSLTRGDAEEVGVKAVNIFEKAAPTGHDLARSGRALIIEAAKVKAAARNLADRIDAIQQCLPEGARVVNAAGEAATDSDNRYRFVSVSVAVSGFSGFSRFGAEWQDGLHGNIVKSIDAIMYLD